MAFRTPNFNLSVNIWHRSPAVSIPNDYTAPDLTVKGNLSPGERVIVDSVNVTFWVFLAVPKLTDIRANWNGGANRPDLVEVPAGSKRFYACDWVDDVGKGFGNEYRRAYLVFNGSGQQFTVQGLIAVPIPLP